mmetsp:Transcript_47684/g.102136  ORF Transcript_47684/g.102136 Transcript_47684/m.102136 type:complete len:209 (-) Transcript_47684:764-1390(-)
MPASLRQPGAAFLWPLHVRGAHTGQGLLELLHQRALPSLRADHEGPDGRPPWGGGSTDSGGRLARKPARNRVELELRLLGSSKNIVWNLREEACDPLLCSMRWAHLWRLREDRARQGALSEPSHHQLAFGQWQTGRLGGRHRSEDVLSASCIRAAQLLLLGLPQVGVLPLPHFGRPQRPQAAHAAASCRRWKGNSYCMVGRLEEANSS